MLNFDKKKIVKTKSTHLKSTGRISKQLQEEKELLTSRLVDIDNTLASLKENPNLEKLVEIIIVPLEVE